MERSFLIIEKTSTNNYTIKDSEYNVFLHQVHAKCLKPFYQLSKLAAQSKYGCLQFTLLFVYLSYKLPFNFMLQLLQLDEILSQLFIQIILDYSIYYKEEKEKSKNFKSCQVTYQFLCVLVYLLFNS